MPSKLVFTVDCVTFCERVVDKLRSLGIHDSRIGVIAYDRTATREWSDTDFLYSDVIPATRSRTMTRASAGVVAGLKVVAATPGYIIGGAGLKLAPSAGASFKTLVSGLIGSTIPENHLLEYEDALNQGQLLLAVHVEDDEEIPIKATLLLTFPSLQLEEASQHPLDAATSRAL